MMTTSSDPKWHKWERTRAKGRNRFIWVTGVLCWGVLTGLVWSVVMAMFQGWDRLGVLIPIALIAFPIGGYWFGSNVWRKTEERYDEHLK
jgi:hypothetical protein